VKIGLILKNSTSWTGGLSYQTNLLEALRQYAPDVEVYLLTQDDTGGMIEGYNYSVITYPFPKRGGVIGRWNRVASRLFGYDLPLRKALRNVPGGGVDVIFPGGFFVGRNTALLYWIPDFQHIHLAEMFTAAEVWKRDEDFKQGIRRATLVVLSSQDSRKDFSNFSPEYSHKVRVMNFVAWVPPSIYKTDPRTVVVQYDLPERFFYLPNQFWKHKNHMILLEAVKILKDKGIRVFIVCTGNPSDYRDPTYFAELLQKISLWGLREQVALLGLVPREHIHLLIRQSICVLNPSLFEGWSTTVEETKSTGKRLLLSDLEVHREQNPPAAAYFDRHDAKDLASKLAEIWANAPSGPDCELEQRARTELPARMQEFSNTFLSIAREAMNIAAVGKISLERCGQGSPFQ